MESQWRTVSCDMLRVVTSSFSLVVLLSFWNTSVSLSLSLYVSDVWAWIKYLTIQKQLLNRLNIQWMKLPSKIKIPHLELTSKSSNSLRFNILILNSSDFISFLIKFISLHSYKLITHNLLRQFRGPLPTCLYLLKSDISIMSGPLLLDAQFDQ